MEHLPPDELSWQIQAKGMRAYGALLCDRQIFGIFIVSGIIPKIRLFLEKPFPRVTNVLLPGGILVLQVSSNLEIALRRRRRADFRFREVVEEDRFGDIGLTTVIAQEQGSVGNQIYIVEATGAVFENNQAYVVLNVMQMEHSRVHID